MHIGLLTSEPENYSSTRLAEEARKRGHDVTVAPYLDCVLHLAGPPPVVSFQGQALQFDAVIPRIGPSKTFEGAAVVEHFERAGVFCLNTAQAIRLSRDKLRTLQALAHLGLPIPKSAFTASAEATPQLLDAVGGAPVVVKLVRGTQGKGVVMAPTAKAAEAVIAAFATLKGKVLVQEFIKEAGGRDLRVFVVGGRAVAAMERQGPEGDFRSNLHLGGTAQAVKLSAQERALAVRATKVMGLHVAGVDLLRSHRGPLVLEVNSSPGLEGIEAATGKNVAGEVLAWLEKARDSWRVK